MSVLIIHIMGFWGLGRWALLIASLLLKTLPMVCSFIPTMSTELRSRPWVSSKLTKPFRNIYAACIMLTSTLLSDLRKLRSLLRLEIRSYFYIVSVKWFEKIMAKAKFKREIDFNALNYVRIECITSLRSCLRFWNTREQNYSPSTVWLYRRDNISTFVSESFWKVAFGVSILSTCQYYIGTLKK